MTLATTGLRCMSIPGAPPRITSMRTTWSAGIRASTSLNESLLDEGRRPSISTLPAAPESPRTLPPPSKANPGMRSIIALASPGREAAKKPAS